MIRLRGELKTGESKSSLYLINFQFKPEETAGKFVKKQMVRLRRSAAVIGMLIGTFGIESVSGLEGNGGYDAAIFQADYVQSLSDFSSGIVNPALLYRVNQMRLEAGFYRWNLTEPGSLGYQEASFLYPHRLNHTLGLTIIGSGSPIEETKVGIKGEGQISKTGRMLKYGDMWFVGHYAWKMMPWLVVGVNLKVRDVREFDEGDAWGVGGDIGFYWNPIDNYRFGDLGVSVNFQDIVPTRMGWVAHDTLGAKVNESRQVGVTRFRVGVRYSCFNDRLVMDGEGVVDNAFGKLWKWAIEDSEIVVNGVKKLPPIAYRGGVNIKWQFIPQVWLKAGWSNNEIPYMGFSFNAIYLLPEMINYVSYDFNVGYSVAENERGLTLMNRLSTDFGPTREQRESKRMYDLLILAPMDAYNEAMRLYLAGKYWEASYAFGKVMSLYPNFYLNDKAAFYMGNCYRFLQLNGIAREGYKSALEEFTTSDMRSKYMYGLENIDYREGKYEDALRNHAFITNLYPESEIRPDADYLAGEIHFQKKNYRAAEQLLIKLKPSDPSYLYSQYTLSIINIENRKIDAAITNLKHIVSDTTQDPGAQLLQEAAYTKLGHLYFEQVALRNAVDAYKHVPEESSYGDEAMLGTAWAWIKANQPAMCIQTIDRLMMAHGESPLIPEAYLLKGYGLMLQKNFREAIAVLEKSLQLLKGTYITEADLRVKEKGFRQFEQTFEPTAQKMRRNALRRPTDKTIDERGGLRTEFDKFAKETREFFKYQLLAKSHKRFFMRKEEVEQDVSYALAKATNMIKTRKQSEILQKGQKEEQNINQEINKLKKQLEKENKK
jgi:tetratricopeptide (TPR) repeat protein